MPKIVSINNSGYFSYGVMPTIYLDSQGLVLVKGLNLDRGGSDNGSGKTSLFNTLVQILYGKNPSGETGESVVHEAIGKSFGRVIFFDDKNVQWRVTEVRKWRKTDKTPDESLIEDYKDDPAEILELGLKYSGSDVFLERWDISASKWMDERATNRSSGEAQLRTKATRNKIVDIFGIDYEQFMSVAYMEQQQSLKFISGTHKQKLEVLTNLCDLGKWDERVLAIRKRKSEIDIDRLTAESTLVGLKQVGGSILAADESQIELLEVQFHEMSQNLVNCDTEIIICQNKKTIWESKLNSIDAEIAAAIKELRNITGSREPIRTKLDLLARQFSADCNNIRNKPRDVSISNLELEIAETRGHIQARRYDLEQLLAGSGKCPRCRTNVTIEHLMRQRELLQIEIRELDEKVLNLSTTHSKLVTEWQFSVQAELDLTSNNYDARRKYVETELSSIDSMISAYSNQVELLKSGKVELGDSPQHQLNALEQKRRFFLSEKTRCDEKRQSWSQQKKKHDDYKELLQEAQARLLQFDDEVVYLSALEKLFGDKGIKAYKLNNLLNVLNHTIREYIDILTDGMVKLWVTQYREKTDGELTADIQIMVQEGQKKKTPLGLYSGGERQQIMLAFIGAFWQIASQYGAGVNLLLLDEILGPLDDINAEKVFDFLQYMQNKGKSTVLIVTHNQNIKRQMVFDKEWTIVKHGGISSIKYDE